MADLVCPECGNGSFTATLTTRTEYTYNVDEAAGMLEVDESVVDGGDLSDIETVHCTDCGGDFYPELDSDPDLGNGEGCYLVTQEQYDYEPDYEGITEARMASREPAGDVW